MLALIGGDREREHKRIPWDVIFSDFAEKYSWTPEQVLNLTLRQVRVLRSQRSELIRESDRPQTIEDVSTKAGREFVESKIELAVQNLMEGRRWDTWRK